MTTLKFRAKTEQDKWHESGNSPTDLADFFYGLKNGALDITTLCQWDPNLKLFLTVYKEE